jgi:hypothetical protein
MATIQGEKAKKFVAWLAVVKGFLPSSMSIEEASNIFLRREAERELEEKENGKKEH